MDNEHLASKLKLVLQSRGVQTHRLLLDVSDDLVVICGEVDTYYESQLTQVEAKLLGEGRQVINNLLVVSDR